LRGASGKNTAKPSCSIERDAYKPQSLALKAAAGDTKQCNSKNVNHIFNIYRHSGSDATDCGAVSPK